MLFGPEIDSVPHPLPEMPGRLRVEMRGPALGDYSPGRGCWEYPAITKTNVNQR